MHIAFVSTWDARDPTLWAGTSYHMWRALEAQGIRGRGGEEIDHIELFGPSKRPGVQSQNFVLCPGKAYDRSPCGTGTSAKLACLAEFFNAHFPFLFCKYLNDLALVAGGHRQVNFRQLRPSRSNRSLASSGPSLPGS